MHTDVSGADKGNQESQEGAAKLMVSSKPFMALVEFGVSGLRSGIEGLEPSCTANHHSLPRNPEAQNPKSAVSVNWRNALGFSTPPAPPRFPPYLALISPKP